jgi:F0F1-type ATP synthase gamma subunit
MASIQETKKRKISVENIYKITKAMELVSIAKSKKYQKKLTSVRVFKDGIYEVMDTMLKDKEIKKHFLFKRRSHNKKTL